PPRPGPRREDESRRTATGKARPDAAALRPLAAADGAGRAARPVPGLLSGRGTGVNPLESPHGDVRGPLGPKSAKKRRLMPIRTDRYTFADRCFPSRGREQFSTAPLVRQPRGSSGNRRPVPTGGRDVSTLFEPEQASMLIRV